MRKFKFFGWMILSVGCISVANAQTDSIETRLGEADADSDARTEAIETEMEAISDSELPNVLDSLTHASGSTAAECRKDLVRRWAEADAPRAAEWVAQLREGSFYCSALEQLVITWANKDLPSAVAWVSALPEGPERDAAVLDVAYEAARTQPVTALEMAGQLSATPERDELLVHAVSQWAVTDAKSASAWAGNITDPVLRERLLSSVSIGSAEQDGMCAAALASNTLTGDELYRASVCVVQRWGQHSPQDAAEWVSTFPDMPVRDIALRNLLGRWIARDLKSADQWLNNLPNGALRERAGVAYNQALGENQ